ncbi:period circadian -like protein [Labeo rohita]|uniref:Period circadian-like protein n=1 Tax=Labeo rohita TaxID=84645 RepID=A0A498NLG7_LABRO|nr:period circadian -like protein [Labeo rohita]
MGESSPPSNSENSGTGSSPRGVSVPKGSTGDNRGTNSDDTDGLSSGNDSGERESEGGNGSRGRQSNRSYQSSSSQNGKDSGMCLETTESNKSSNSHSPSPPSSSLAYSLLSASSEQDPPSTSGCSSNQSARIQTQKELMRALNELKIRLPPERKMKGRSSTLNALKYALSCVRQVRANQEYYHQWNVEECHGCSLDLSTFTVEELDNITSEYTLKNTDTFSMAVSFLSGKVVYISPQGSSLLRSKPEKLHGVLFSELLAPQDVSTFYSNTAPCKLPPWASCIGSASPPADCTQEKSMFCRISGDVSTSGDVRYYPFRLTPYLLTLQDSDAAYPQPCCLLIAERVHSGYEDKRVFTTSHTPSCLFQEVDERAVPLLGYLPQDLVGTPVLLCIHPDDRPIMVAIHKKILQFAGQPFDHAPLRMCAHNGEYLTIDTSWSSFINPWSRKVAFIVGRHKVRTSPLNEDVFTLPRGLEERTLTPDIAQLSEQIHRLLVQPVHSGSSQGYGSLASNGSHEHQPSAASSSESSGPGLEDPSQLHKPMTFQQICKDVHMVKTSGQQVFIESRNRPPLKKHSTAGALQAGETAEPGSSLGPCAAPPSKSSAPSMIVRKEPPTTFSYQQINCLDSIVRYLESCNIPNTVKRKCGSSSCTASSTSDDDKQQDASGNSKGPSVSLVEESALLPPLAMHSKAESVASVTSQCSFSSTIVHVGDKKPPESDIVMEEVPPTPNAAPPTTQPQAPLTAMPSLPPSPAPDRDAGRRGGPGAAGGGERLGLTKEVLSAHTQQEEQNFLCRFRDLSKLRVFDPTSAVRRRTTAPLARGVRCSRDYPAAGSSGRRRGRGGKRLKHQETSEQTGSCSPAGPPRGIPALDRPSISSIPMGPAASSSSWPTSGSQTSVPSVPYPPGVLPLYPVYPHLSHPVSDPNMQTGLRFPIQNSQMAPPMVHPMMAFVLPNYMFPQPNMGMPQPFYSPNSAFPFPAANIASLAPCQVPTPVPRAHSRSSTPHSYSQREAGAEREGAESPLFQSRCSSPLNLLQLEESPSNRFEVTSGQQTTSPMVGQGGGAGGQASSNQRGSAVDSKENENGETTNESNQDAMSTSSDLLDLLLQEDSRSGTGSAASGSGSSGTGSSGSGSGSSGSGSNGCSSSGSGTRSSQSSNTSKYFGSVDSSENSHSRKQTAGGDGEAQFIKCVLQDPIWLLMANTDEKTMMTYQLPIRDRDSVLKEDRAALRAMQKQQPRFTEEQKSELSEVHPWIRTGRLPRAINISACVGCRSSPTVPSTAPFDVEIHEMEFCSVLEVTEEGATAEKHTQADTAMEKSEAEGEGELCKDQEVETIMTSQINDQEMMTEEQEASSQIEEEMGASHTQMTH